MPVFGLFWLTSYCCDHRSRVHVATVAQISYTSHMYEANVKAREQDEKIVVYCGGSFFFFVLCVRVCLLAIVTEDEWIDIMVVVTFRSCACVSLCHFFIIIKSL